MLIKCVAYKLSNHTIKTWLGVLKQVKNYEYKLIYVRKVIVSFYYPVVFTKTTKIL